MRIYMTFLHCESFLGTLNNEFMQAISRGIGNWLKGQTQTRFPSDVDHACPQVTGIGNRLALLSLVV